MTEVEYNFTRDLIFKLTLQEVPEAAIELAKKFIPNMENLVYNPETFSVDNPINMGGIDIKSTEFDFKFSLSNEKSFEYEMQNHKVPYDLKSRILKYYSDLMSACFKKGEGYNHKKCYTIWFLENNLFDDNKSIRTFYLKDEDNNKLYDYASITIVEFAKISEEDYNNDVWKRLFITNDMDLLKGVDEIMDKVVNKILDYNSDQAIKEQLRAEEEWQRGYNSAVAASKEEGIAEGIEKGRFEEKKKTAKKMKERGYSNNEIAELTGLSLEEISKL